jgi:hypothetical protein
MKTMSATKTKPSSFSPEIKACSKTLILAGGSSTLSLTGIGTLSSSLESSIFSSWRT